ncbi:MAG: hypothetical protein CR957_00090 [Gammaproteobacteria bacterium]|nr:MAG: hypothetical protein CR957_00090 [Gammaproteobacteria bacterium]
MVVPFQEKTAVVLPRNLVEYVLPYATPLPSAYEHEALVGSILYQNEKVPVLDLQLVYNNGENGPSVDSGHRRLVVLSCVSLHTEFSSYAIIADDAPRLFNTTPDNLQEVDKVAKSPFYSYIKLDKQPQELVTVDLEALEALIFADYLVKG